METTDPLEPTSPSNDVLGAFRNELAQPPPTPQIQVSDFGPSSQRDTSPQATAQRGSPNYLLDVGVGVLEGVESFGESLTNLGISGANLLLDEEDELDEVDFGVFQSQTTAGHIVSGITQFAVGFIPVVGQVGKLARAGRLLSAVKGASTAARIGRAAIAGGITDFIAFDEHEQRLANLIEASPALANPLTAFLAADEDDGFAEGRLKNVIEGAALGIPLDLALASFKGYRKIANAQGNEKAVAKAQQEAAELIAEAGDAAARGESGVVRGTGNTSDVTAEQAPLVSSFGDASTRIAKALDAILGEQVNPTPLATIYENIAKDFSGPTAFNARILKDPTTLEPIVRAITSQLEDYRIRIGDAELISHAKRFTAHLNENGASIFDSLEADNKVLAFLAAREIVYGATNDALLEATRLAAAKAVRATGTEAAGAATDAALESAKSSVNFLAAYRQLGTYEGRAFRARQIKTEAVDATINQNVDMIVALEAALKGGSKKERGNALRHLMTAQDPVSSVKELERRTKSGWGERHNEFWINSILSSFRTQTVNLIGNSTKLLVQPAELILGGVLSGNMKAAGTGLRTYRYMLSNFNDSIRMAKEAFATGEAMLDPHHAVLDTKRGSPARRAAQAEGPHTPLNNTFNNQQNAISSMGFGVDKGNHPVWAGFIDVVGGAINLPGKFLVTFDEFFKQMNFRSRTMAQLAGDAAGDGVSRTSAELNRYIKDNLEDVLIQNDRITNGATFTSKDLTARTYRLAQDARNYAEESTWTQDLRPGSKAKWIQDGARAHPSLQLVVPFIRTPTNIILDTVQHTPGLQYLSKTFKEQLESPDPLIRAQARGKQALGAGVAMTALALAGNGYVTGGGPKDFKQRQTLEGTGWRPYSIVIPQEDGSKKYISFSRLEPFGAVVGLFADYAEIGAQMEERDQDSVAGAIALSLSRNLTSKTFLFGLTDFMDAITSEDESQITSWLERRAATYLPNVVNDFNNDPYLRETNDLLERVQSKIPGWSQQLAPRRNFLGEAITAPPGYLPWVGGTPVANGLSPVGLSTSVTDPVKQELGRLGRAFAPPTARIENQQIDLTTFRMPDGQHAYDRYQELVGEVTLRGKTLAESLHDLVTNEQYLAIPQQGLGPNVDNPRVQLITTVRSRYARAARAQILRESPEILSAVKEARFNRIQARRANSLGASDSQLLTRPKN